jgi:hypothetical protein
MIMRWRQLILHYGGQIDTHKDRFEEAGEATYALLCCRFSSGDDRLASSGGSHAERKLLESVLWMEDIPAALADWSELDRGRIVVTMAINRTPCPTCADALERSLREMQWKHAKSFEHARFVLACRGAYEGRPTAAGRYPNATTTAALRRLADVGWELCVLQTGDTLPPSGRELLQTLERMSDRRVVAVSFDD